jgi:ribosomal protein S8
MTNFALADLIARLNISSKKRLVSVRVSFTKFSLSVLHIFLKNGIINGLTIENNYITVYLKYYKLKPVFRELIIVSRPGKRVFWTLSFLSLKYSVSNFSGFYIISTSKGLLTSNDCLLGLNVSGEIILKISI